MGEVSTIGLDIAKSVFQVHGVDVDGAVVIRRRISRAKILEFFATLPSCLVGIEACPSAHYWGRELQTLGHTVRLMPPSYVKAYLKRSKNDANDAAAICEAVTRPSMRFVLIKSEQQQSGLMLHRGRQLLVRQRTMLSNAIRGHLAELGIISAKGRNGTAELLEVLANARDDRIPVAAQLSLDALARQYANTTSEIRVIDKQIHGWHRSCAESRRLEEISPALARSSPLLWLPKSAIGRRSRPDVAWRPGLGLCLGSIRLAARRGSVESQNRAIDICDGC
jgi:transposase